MLELGEGFDVMDSVTGVVVGDELLFNTTEEVDAILDDADVVESSDKDKVYTTGAPVALIN